MQSQKLEVDNPHDWCVIKVTDRSTDATQAYLTRGSRSLIRPIFKQELISTQIFLKPKAHAMRVGYKITHKCDLIIYQWMIYNLN